MNSVKDMAVFAMQKKLAGCTGALCRSCTTGSSKFRSRNVPRVLAFRRLVSSIRAHLALNGDAFGFHTIAG